MAALRLVRSVLSGFWRVLDGLRKGLHLIFLLLFAVFHFYARFDRYTEHKASGTPLRTTIPMMLTVALAYELMPALSHFSILLPAALLLTAIARDFMLWWTPAQTTEASEKETDQ